MKYITILLFIFVQSNLTCAAIIQANEGEFPLAIIHINDFHARFEETSVSSSSCTTPEANNCIGGYARVVTKVNELKQKHASKNVVYLNAGDNFQGTLWYNIGRYVAILC